MSPSRSSVALATDLRDARDHAPVQSLAGRRRKARDLDEDEDGAVAKGVKGAVEAEGEWTGNADGVLPGCGRTLCQKCCFETPSRCADSRFCLHWCCQLVPMNIMLEQRPDDVL